MKLYRNIANQTIHVGSLVDVGTGARLATGATARVAKDGTWAAGAGTLAVEETDQWKYTPTQSETDCARFVVAIDHADAVSPIVVSFTTKLIRTWYVATTGNDSNVGTSESPKLTIAAAIIAAADGDTVVVRAGTYAEAVTLNKSLRLEGTGWDAVISQSGGFGAGLLIDADSCTVENIKVVGGGTAAHAVRLGTNATNVVLDRVWGDAQGSAFESFSGANNFNIYAHRCRFTAHSDCVSLPSNSGVVIEDCTIFTDATIGSLAIEGMRLAGSEAVVRNCDIVVAKNVADAKHVYGVHVGSGLVIEGCTINVSESNTGASGNVVGIKTQASGDNVASVGNTINSSNAGSGAVYDIDASIADTKVVIDGGHHATSKAIGNVFSPLRPSNPFRTADVDASGRITIQGTLNTLDALDTAQDAQHATTHNRLPAALVGGRIDSNVGAWHGTTIPGVDTAGYPRVTIKNGSGQGEIDTLLGGVKLKNDQYAEIANASHSVLLHANISAVASQTQYTLDTGGLSETDDIFIGMPVVILDASTFDTTVKVVTAWDASLQLLTIDSAPLFTVVPGDVLRILAGNPRIDATVSSRASQASVDDVPTNAEFNARSLPSASYSTLTASDVWASTTRTLTSFGTLIADIWHHLVSAITTTNSIGKLLKDNVDATVSSRASQASVDAAAADAAELNDTKITTQRATNLDNLDAPVSGVSGGGVVIPVNQVPVPLERTWILKHRNGGLVGEVPLERSVGTELLFAADYRNDLATNGRLTNLDSVVQASGPVGGLTFPSAGGAADQGVDKSQAKWKIVAVLPGTYEIDLVASYSDSSGGGTSPATVTLIVT